MERNVELRDPLTVWFAVAFGSLLALGIGVIGFPKQVYDEFIWRYFWGPVVADASAVGTSGCAIRQDGAVQTVLANSECLTAIREGLVVSRPGYTPVSTISYAVVLLFILVGVVLIFDKWELELDRDVFYGSIPFVFFGGALRVVEDANAELLRETGNLIVPLPWVGLIISPLIYFTVFAVAFGSLLLSKWLVYNGLVDRSTRVALGGLGTVWLALPLALLAYFILRTEFVDINGLVPLVVLGGATIITIIVWIGTEEFAPVINEGTGLIGPVIVWGHSVDGLANVVSLDWAAAVGMSQTYAPKHVVNRLVIAIAETVQPTVVSQTIGTAWPFLLLKIGISVGVVWVFNEEVFEDSSNFSMLMLIAILAVGLGPGTRDFLRATLGI